MERLIGDNNFGKRFDFYKWSAPFFDTPQEVVRYKEAPIGVQRANVKIDIPASPIGTSSYSIS